MRRDVMEMDPRLAARRARVAEGHARRSLVRLLWLLVVVALAGMVAWVLRSPLLAVEEVVIAGAVRSSPSEVMASHGLVRGMPMISVDGARLEAAIEEDPWVASADVRRDWPRRVTVTVEERVPLAWAQTATGWAHVAVDGVVLERGSPKEGAPLIVAPDLAPEDVSGDHAALGALVFLASLRDDLVTGTTVHLRGDEVVATVASTEVRLGRPTDMDRKARALAAVMDAGIPPGSVVTLVAPTRPAVLPPGAAEEATVDTDAPDTEAQGP